ncbi:MAG: transcription termination/antitermination protein NusG [Planctomycetota bacterium]
MPLGHIKPETPTGVVTGPGSLGPRVVEVATSEKIEPPSLAAPSQARWHALHTRARQEKALAQTLAAANVEHYLPLLNRTRYRGRRKRVVREPLFASYLFLHGPTEATYLAVATKRVANVITVADQDRFTRELEQIRRALDNGADLSPYRYLRIGRRVRVTAGSFCGIEGMIEEWSKPDRLVLQIDALGRATSLEIDASLLEPVD